MTSDFLTSRVLLNLDSEEELGGGGVFFEFLLFVQHCLKDNVTSVSPLYFTHSRGHVCIGSAGGFESTITLPMEPCKKGWGHAIYYRISSKPS